MTFEIALAPRAARQLRKFDPLVRRRIQAALELLATEPRPPAATRLVGGSGEWRVRTGDYRIVYEIEDDRLPILVLTLEDARSKRASQAADLRKRVVGPVGLEPTTYGLKGHCLGRWWSLMVV